MSKSPKIPFSGALFSPNFQYIGSEDEARAIYNKLETSAKDLGLNINDLPIAKQIADAVNRNSDTYQDVLSEISFSQKELK